MLKARIHPSAEVLTNNIGEGTSIWQNCVVLPGAIIGKDANVSCNVFIENDVIIGDNVTIKSGVQLWDGLRIGNNVFIGPNATFTNDLLPRSKQYDKLFLRTTIEDWVSIGANATILAGITLGTYSMVGAGSVLTKSIEPFTLWYGNPARQHGYVTREGIVVSMDLKDKSGKTYILTANEPQADD